MKRKFTRDSKFLSGVVLPIKKIGLLLILVLFGAGSVLNAQTVRYSGWLFDSLGLEPNNAEIVFASITPIDSAGDGIIDASFTFSLGEITAWGDYSTSVRFRNNGKEPFIDARNGGGFAADDTVNFAFDKICYVWVELDVPLQIYNVHVDTTEGVSPPVLIATDYAFRNTPVANLAIWSLLVTGNGNFCNVNQLALVDAVGEVPGGGETDVRSFESRSGISAFPNPFSNQVEIEMDGSFEYGVYGLSGALILKGVSDGKCIIGEDLARGCYLLKVNQNNISKTVKLIKY